MKAFPKELLSGNIRKKVDILYINWVSIKGETMHDRISEDLERKSFYLFFQTSKLLKLTLVLTSLIF